MVISINDFNRLSEQEKQFVINHGAFNCTLVKFNEGVVYNLVSVYGEDAYSEDDIRLLSSLHDGKWHLVHWDDGDFFLCGDDNLVFLDECVSETSESISEYLRQEKR